MKEHDHICRKMNRVIETSKPNQKLVTQRYLSLCNRQLNKMFDKSGDWGIIGASSAVACKFKEKYGSFYPTSEAVCDRET